MGCFVCYLLIVDIFNDVKVEGGGLVIFNDKR
jgi:hypothetical protein